MNALFEFENSNKAVAKNLGYVGAPVTKLKAGRDSDSWYTPGEYIESARFALGTIDLDPFSSALANEIVGATKYHSEDDSSLNVDWKARTVWMNPPYGPLCGAAVDKFIEQFTAKNFVEGIILVNNSTDTKWFKRLSEHASAWCFTDHRIGFNAPDGKSLGGNTRGQVFIYFGPNVQKFKQQFDEHGLVLQKA
jgi:ParB family chromosome partitioning protein